jgi:hypothetical protein
MPTVTPAAGRQVIFLGATEPRAARPEGNLPREVMLVGQVGLAVSISGMMFVILMFFVLAMKTSLCRFPNLPETFSALAATWRDSRAMS